MTETYEIEFEECFVNGITSYKCSICSELFNNKQLLADHHYSTHVSKTTKNDSVAKDFVIKDVIFVNSENQVLDENLRLFVYKCRLCTTVVAESNDLNNHINSDHNGEEFIIIDDEAMCTWVYKCVACFSELATKQQMNEHISLVHGINEHHRCDICSGYFHKEFMNQHVLLAHMNNDVQEMRIMDQTQESINRIQESRNEIQESRNGIQESKNGIQETSYSREIRNSNEEIVAMHQPKIDSNKKETNANSLSIFVDDEFIEEEKHEKSNSMEVKELLSMLKPVGSNSVPDKNLEVNMIHLRDIIHIGDVEKENTLREKERIATEKITYQFETRPKMSYAQLIAEALLQGF
jgi:DNA-directed RNA polymerase subunit RPC12/RpoP